MVRHHGRLTARAPETNRSARTAEEPPLGVREDPVGVDPASGWGPPQARSYGASRDVPTSRDVHAAPPGVPSADSGSHSNLGLGGVAEAQNPAGTARAAEVRPVAELVKSASDAEPAAKRRRTEAAAESDEGRHATIASEVRAW